MAPQNSAVPVTLDMSTAQPILASAPVTLDMSTAQPITNQGPVPSTDQSARPGVLARSWEGAKQFAEPLTALFAPPQTPTEAALHNAGSALPMGGGAGAVAAYRVAKGIVDSAKNLVASNSPESYKQNAADFQKAVSDFHNHDYRNAIADAAEAATGPMSPLGSEFGAARGNIRELAEGSRPGGNLATPLTRDLLTAGTAYLGGEALGPEEEVAAAKPITSIPVRVNPFRAALSGEKAIQPVTRTIMSNAADAAATDSGVTAAAPTGGVRTFLDNPIAQIAKRERSTYDALNQASGTDLKNLYDYRESLQDALNDPTNIANEQALREKLADTEAQIRTGEAQAIQNKVSPSTLKNAIADTQQRYALQDLKSKVFDNESVVNGNTAAGADESINVNSAIKAVEKLDKPSKYAPSGNPTRLEQALGKDGAATFKKNLYAAQKAGQQAVRYNQIAKWVGRAIGVGVLGGTGFEAAKALGGE